MKTSLTGIKPTGSLHLGNYLGAIRPGLALAETYRTAYFIADYHALTVVRDPEVMRRWVHGAAATWLACGLDPQRTLFYRQSDVPEVFELTWVLACLVATGQLERGHAYKDLVAKGESPNAGIFFYPVLMAADILLYDADVVPVGRDQQQHLELARDVATRVNHVYGDGTVVVPSALLTEAPLVPGLDGHKMSKSRGNAVPLFAPPKELRKTVMRFKTGSETLEEPKSAEGSLVFELYKLVAGESDVRRMADALAAGGYGWGHAKDDLYQAIEAELGDKRERYEQLVADPDHLEDVLLAGARRARGIARETLDRVRTAIGIAR